MEEVEASRMAAVAAVGFRMEVVEGVSTALDLEAEAFPAAVEAEAEASRVAEAVLDPMILAAVRIDQVIGRVVEELRPHHHHHHQRAPLQQQLDSRSTPS